MLTAPAAPADTQQTHLERVTLRTAEAILGFVRLIALSESQTFHMVQLLAAVRRDCGVIAPDSPSRVLRDLKQRGLVSYRVVNRKRSLYLIEGVK